MILCACCNSELTAPQFHNGKPYGWTCIKKVSPEQKRTKAVYVACSEFALLTIPDGSSRNVINFVVNGKRHNSVVVYGDWSTWRTSSTYMQDGVLFVNESITK